MRRLSDSCTTVVRWSCDDCATNVKRNRCNSLKINVGLDIVEYSKVEKSISSSLKSSSSRGGDDGDEDKSLSMSKYSRLPLRVVS